MSLTTEEHFSVKNIRPRFKVEIPCPIDELKEKIMNGLQKENVSCKGRSVDNHITLFLPQEEQHYWSPQLALTLEESEKGSLIRGLYGPRPSVWTMFVFFYTLIGFAILIIGMMGLSYLFLGRSGAVLWLIPVLLIVFLSLYLVSYFGKKMGESQMVTLHMYIEQVTGQTIF